MESSHSGGETKAGKVQATWPGYGCHVSAKGVRAFLRGHELLKKKKMDGCKGVVWSPLNWGLCEQTPFQVGETPLQLHPPRRRGRAACSTFSSDCNLQCEYSASTVWALEL
jgi:hypothetical protein